MRRTTCDHLAELRSAYVDGALSEPDRERLLAHLVSCTWCQRDVQELRAVRQLLHRMGESTATAPTPGELSFRLLSIAGNQAQVPVWSRPFRRTRPGALPSPRRAARTRAAAAALAVGSVLSALGIVGYAAAPPVESAAVGDPSERVRAEFASMLTEFPLTSKAMTAVMMTSKLDLLPTTPGSSNGPRGTTATPLPVTGQMALALLRRTAENSERVSYTGTQQVVASRGGLTISANVRVTSDPEQGTAVKVYNHDGRALVEGFVPASAASSASDDEILLRLRQTYSVTGWVGSTVVGRPVTVVEATTRPARGLSSQPSEPRVAARWWIDNATGVLLWQETYDQSGALSTAAGFTTLSIADKPVFMEHLAPRLGLSTTTTASVALTDVAELASRGWYCRDELAGLSLVRVSSDVVADPDSPHLVYSDGVSAVSVFEQRGVLKTAPVGSGWDGSLGAYVTAGASTMASWQSGDRVLTVVTDGSADLVEEAVHALPHAKPMSRTTMERVRAGWKRVLERVVR